MSEADLFLSGGAPSQKFPEVGARWGGTILSWEMTQQSDLTTGELKFWEDGKPKMQLVLTMQGEPTGFTWEWNGRSFDKKELHDDDGVRRLFVKGNMQQALGKAMRDARGRVEIGAYAELVRTKDIAPNKKGYSPTQTFKAEWTPANKNTHTASALLNEAPEDENPFG